MAVLGRGTGPRAEELAGRSRGTDSQDLATILDPFGAIFVDLGPDRHLPLAQLRLLRLEHCDIATVETSETSTLCVVTRQMSVLATQDICPVSAADICPVTTCTSKDRKAHYHSLVNTSMQDGTKREAVSWKLSDALF